MNRIEHLKKEKKLSYQKIAIRAGISSVYVWELATGRKNNPSYEIMKHISACGLEEPISNVFPEVNKGVGDQDQISNQSERIQF